MARIRLVELGQYAFHYATRLEPRDINPSGHLGNDALVTLVGSARAYVFYSMGLSQRDLGDGSTGIIMSDLAVNYRAEAFMFDEIVIDTHFGEFTRSAFRAFHRVRKGEAVVALAETGLVTFDYRARRIAPVPEEFLKALAAQNL